MARRLHKSGYLPLKDNATGGGLLTTTIALVALGIIMVHSAVASVVDPGSWYARVDLRHTIFAVTAVAVLCLGWRWDYRKIAAGRFPFLATAALCVAVICGLLVFVPGLGRGVGGDYRWIRIGPDKYRIGFQPSELIKFALVIFLSAWLSRKTTNLRSFLRTFIPAALLTVICVGLIITQDFGTAVIVGISACATMLLAGVPWYYLLSLLPPAAGGFYAMVVCSPHRWARIEAMLNPWSQANPSAYQARQSLLAVISGGWFGKGPGAGVLKLGFLPEDSTDFIFSVYCEEWGFAGAIILVGLLVLWIFFARRAAVRSADRFGRVLAGALGFMIALQAVLHIAVALNCMPPTGITMPFISAGGTALVTMAAATALIISVSARGPAESLNP